MVSPVLNQKTRDTRIFEMLAGSHLKIIRKYLREAVSPDYGKGLLLLLTRFIFLSCGIWHGTEHEYSSQGRRDNSIASHQC